MFGDLAFILKLFASYMKHKHAWVLWAGKWLVSCVVAGWHCYNTLYNTIQYKQSVSERSELRCLASLDFLDLLSRRNQKHLIKYVIQASRQEKFKF